MSSRKKAIHNKALNSGQLAEAVVDGIQDEDLILKRQEQICEAALELFLEKGFDSTTIRDICSKSGVNQASIYDYIANKNDILRRLLNKLWFSTEMPSLAERLENNRELPLEENIALFFRDAWRKKRKGTLLVYRSIPHLQADDIKTMRARDESYISELAEQLCIATGVKSDDPRARIIANAVMFMAAFGPMRDWLNRDIDNEVVLETISIGVAAMVNKLADTQ